MIATTPFQETALPPTGPPAPPPTGGSQEGAVAGLRHWVDELFDKVEFLRERPILQALLILVGSFAVARIAGWLLVRLLRNLDARTRIKIDDWIINSVSAPLIRSTVVMGMAVAVEVMPISDPWDLRLRHALVSIAAFVWAPFVFRTTTILLKTASADEAHFHAIEPRTYPLFDNLAKILLFGAFVYLLIVIWGADPSGLLASAGILGIAIGFAAQDTLGNLIAGVFIIADAPYRVGDYITLDSGERGRVLHIGLRSTRLLTRDDIEVTVPNAVMGKAKIINEAGGPSPKHRLRVPVSVAYGSDVDRVRAVLLEIAAAENRISKAPEPRVRFRSFGNSGLEFELLGWIPEPWIRGQTVDSLNMAIYKRFAAEGIEIPYPKRDVYVRGMPPGVSVTGGGGE